MNETGKEGQSGTEIILVLGIAIIILINIIGIYNQMTSSSSCQGAAATARAATDAIADMAEIVHTQAVGSRSSLFINLSLAARPTARSRAPSPSTSRDSLT